MRHRAGWQATVGPEGPCPACGAEEWEEPRRAMGRLAVQWLMGGGLVRLRERMCRSCGHRGGSTGYLVFGGGRHRWWRVSLRLLRVLRHRRSMQPVPAMYLAIGTVGSFLGLAARRLAGWPWWAVPAALVSGTWAFFLTSAFRGPQGGHSLRTEVLSVISPERGMARRLEEEDERYRRVSFPLFGLDASWQGPRVARGMSSSSSRDAGYQVEGINLLHGDPLDPEFPRLLVTTRRSVQAELLRRRRLAERLWEERPPPGLSPQEFARWSQERRREIEGRPDPEWETRTFPVDGRPVSFAFLGDDDAWVASGGLGELVIELKAEGVSPDELSLVQVDVEPYLEGRRQVHERRRREHGH